MLAVASLPARLTLRISSSSSSSPSSTSSSSSSSSQDGTKSPVAAQQAKGLILHIPASEKDLVTAVEAKFVAAAAAAGGRWNGPPSIWCKLRDVRLQELSGGAGGRAGGGGGTKVTDARLNCKPSVVMLPVCHSSVVEIAAALKVSLKHEAQQLEAAVASAHSAHGAAGPASARAGVGGSAAAPAQNTRASAQGAAPAAAAAAAVPAQQNGGRASDKRKAAEAGLADGPQRGRGGGAAKGGRGAAAGGEVRVRTGVLGAGERLLGFLLHVTFLAYTRLSLSIPLTNVTLLCRTLYTHARTHTRARAHTHTRSFSFSERARTALPTHARMHACTRSGRDKCGARRGAAQDPQGSSRSHASPACR